MFLRCFWSIYVDFWQKNVLNIKKMIFLRCSDYTFGATCRPKPTFTIFTRGCGRCLPPFMGHLVCSRIWVQICKHVEKWCQPRVGTCAYVCDNFNSMLENTLKQYSNSPLHIRTSLDSPTDEIRWGWGLRPRRRHHLSRDSRGGGLSRDSPPP